VRAAEPAGPHPAISAQTSVVSEDQRLEHEFEGGGAPSQRPRGRRASLLMRLWRSAMHPARIRDTWSRVLPQPS